jgi:hypothetical protein
MQLHLCLLVSLLQPAYCNLAAAAARCVQAVVQQLFMLMSCSGFVCHLAWPCWQMWRMPQQLGPWAVPRPHM